MSDTPSMMQSIVSLRRRPLLCVCVLSGCLLVLKVGGLADAVGNARAADAPQQQAEDDITAKSEAAAQNVLVDAPSPAPVVDPAMMSQSELELLRDLSARRNALDAREQDLELRSRLLEAAEQRVETKIAELKSLEADVKKLLVAHETQEDKKLDSVVKVYEKMKPADAARILQGLSMDIQVDVAMRMSELRMAPVLAKMDAKSAQKLTTQLATRQMIDLDQRPAQ